MKNILVVIVFLLASIWSNAQEYSSNTLFTSLTLSYSENETASLHKPYFSSTDSNKNESSKVFIAYEIGEAIFNKFQSLSGEIGIRFKNQHLLRLTHVNLNLTEEHLSSGFAGAVDGDNVKGKQFGFEAFYDFPIFFNSLYIGPSIGYYKNEYQHTILNERLENSSFSFGSSLSIRETNIFKLKGLYYSFSIPIRINLNPIEETNLGSAIIKNSTWDNSIWLFIGYEF